MGLQARHYCASHRKKNMKQTIFWILTLAMASEAHAGAFGRAVAVAGGQALAKYFTLASAITYAVAVMDQHHRRNNTRRSWCHGVGGEIASIYMNYFNRLCLIACRAVGSKNPE
jgi:hypothetical protein